MIKPIIRDTDFLQIPSQEATKEDLSVGEDLLDTLQSNQETCVGLAANMIGVSKRIVVIRDKSDYLLLFNPKMISFSKPFQTKEGCLSLLGERETTRYEKIKIEYQTREFQTRFKTFTGWTAQIIQHELDHCDGILI